MIDRVVKHKLILFQSMSAIREAGRAPRSTTIRNTPNSWLYIPLEEVLIQMFLSWF